MEQQKSCPPLPFQLTERLRSAVNLCVSWSGGASGSSRVSVEDLRKYADPHQEFIDFSDIEKLSTLYRSIRDDLLKKGAPADVTAAQKIGDGWVHELIQGSGLYERPKKSTYSKAMQAHLAKLRAKQDRAEYMEMVKDLPHNKRAAAKGMFGNFASITKDMSVGANLLLVMFTGFVVFWYIGKSIWPHKPFMSVCSGAIGLILAMLLETALLIVRDQKNSLAARLQAEREAALLEGTAGAVTTAAASVSGATAAGAGSDSSKSPAAAKQATTTSSSPLTSDSAAAAAAAAAGGDDGGDDDGVGDEDRAGASTAKEFAPFSLPSSLASSAATEKSGEGLRARKKGKN